MVNRVFFFDVVITDENLRGVKTSSIQMVKKETGNYVEIKSANSRRSDNRNRDYKTQRTIKNKERNYIPRRWRVAHAHTMAVQLHKYYFRYIWLAFSQHICIFHVPRHE